MKKTTKKQKRKQQILALGQEATIKINQNRILSEQIDNYKKHIKMMKSFMNKYSQNKKITESLQNNNNEFIKNEFKNYFNDLKQSVDEIRESTKKLKQKYENNSDSYFDDIKGKFHREGGTGLGGTFEGSGFEHFDVDSGLWWGEHYDDVYRDRLYSLYLSYHRYFVLRERNGDYYLVEYKEKQNGENYYTYHYYCYRYYVSDKYMRMELSDEIFNDVFEYVKTKNKRLTEQDYIDYINSRNNI